MAGEVGPRAVEIARGWLGTPYRHQAAMRGAGADCLGLIRGVWREMYGEEPERVPAYSPDWACPDARETLLEAAARHLHRRAPSEEGAAGDVLLFRVRERGAARHLGIAAMRADGPSFIHAMCGHGVIESAFTHAWARRVVARFTFPGGS
jgi:NlpC/P60 family putative phage cell wall peptidase